MMPRLKTSALKLPSGLVSWPKQASSKVISSLGGGASALAAGASGALSSCEVPVSPQIFTWQECSELLQAPLCRLRRLCAGDAPAVPLLRRLKPTVDLLDEALGMLSAQLLAADASGAGEAPPAAADAVAPLSAAADFLCIFEAPERQLELALTLHSNRQVRKRVLGHLEEALTALCGASGGADPSLDLAQEQVRADAEALQELCGTAWELHFYFTFLDIKGDKALLRGTAEELARLLGCSSIAELAPCVAHTGQWVVEAFRALAQQGHLEALKRRHVAALQRWRGQFSETALRLPEARMRFLHDARHGEYFWEAYFSNLFHIAWADFAEAFEEFYALGSCPVDVQAELRRRLCGGTLGHRVRKHHWDKLLKDVGPEKGGEAVLDTLLQAVAAGAGQHIFRAKPLTRPSAAGVAGGAVSAEASARTCLVKPAVVGAPSTEDSVLPLPPGKGAGKLKGGVPMSAVAHSADPTSTPNPARFHPRNTFNEDADPTRATPVDARVHGGPMVHGARMSWDQYVAGLAQSRKTWYIAPDFKDGSSMEQLVASAAAVVSGSAPCSRKACVLRVVSGDLARHRPLLGPARLSSMEGEAPVVASGEEPIPALVVGAAFGSKAPGVTKFGRGSSRRSLVPDLQMDEPIASRSHFSVVFDEEKDRYCLMDAGSKWGTFLKVGSRMPLSCGDWIRVGLAEFVVRYCGGNCNCRRSHRHYKLHSFKVQQEQSRGHSLSSLACAVGSTSSGASGTEALDATPSSFTMGRSIDEGPREEDVVHSVLAGFKQTPWLSESTRLSQAAGLASAGLGAPGAPGAGQPAGEAAAAGGGADAAEDAPGRAAAPASCPAGAPASLPVPPLELEFICGPRTGERLTLTQRRCTLGRGEASTIQISDPMLANVSRVHCIFEYIGDKWHIRDNGSTNGTWRRLSCVLEPSELVPVEPGMSVLAGVHEFRIEEGDLGTWWPQSAAADMLQEISDRGRGGR